MVDEDFVGFTATRNIFTVDTEAHEVLLINVSSEGANLRTTQQYDDNELEKKCNI